jgi:putative ABC transport system permease protein
VTSRSPTDFPAAPRVARWLLSLRVPEREREFVLGDLAEGYAMRRSSVGAWYAWTWYWKQTVSMLRSRWHRQARPNPSPRREHSMTSLWSDLRYVTRALRRAPLFSVLVVLTLTVGIGATSALFSVVYPVLLAAPPYPGSDRLVMLSERNANGADDGIGWLTFDDTQREAEVFSSMAAVAYWSPTLQSGDAVLRLNGQRVSHTFFRTIGTRPALGRDFAPEEDRMETRRVAILSDALWRRHFGADSSIVGRTALINGVGYLIAGVMPANFQSLLFPQAEIWGPLGYDSNGDSSCRTCHHLRVIGRLRDAISLDGARERLDAFFATLRQRHPDQYGSVGALVRTLQDEVSGDVRASLLGLFAAVGLLLLLACANVANLFLGRTGERHTELSVRMALGAERSRLVRLVSLEALVLALGGGVFGVLVAWGGTRVLVDFLEIPPELATRVSTAAPVILFALLATTLSAVVGGTLPALLALKESALADIRVGTRSLVGHVRHRLRNALVVAEVALALSLLVGAGLQIRSLQRALLVETGYESAGVLTMEVGLTGPRYQEDGAARAYFRQLLAQTSEIPGVQAVGITTQLPLGGNFDSRGVHRDDKPSANPSDDPSAQRFAVSPEYLEAMKIRIVRGRGLTSQDREGSALAVLFNEAAVREIFGGEDPIGKRVRVSGDDGPASTVVGVVANVRHLSIERDVESQFYMPFDQTRYEESDYVLVARTATDPSSIATAVTRAARALDPGVVLTNVRPMRDVVGDATQSRRLASALIGAFAAIALLLATGGLYGVMTASVIERSREMGLRTALGATPRSVLGLVLKRGVMLTMFGCAIGIGGVIVAHSLLRQFVFGVTPTDPITLVVVVASLGVVALGACVIPAWRAAHVDPAITLRE